MIIHADLSSYLQLSAGSAGSLLKCHVFGRLKAFEPESENISTYLERVHLYFEANGIEDNKQTSVLLAVIGTKNYSIIRSLVAQRQDLCRVGDCFEGSFSAQSPASCRTFPFTSALRLLVSQCWTSLQICVDCCEFGDFLNQALREHTEEASRRR